ncbi:MAG: hypothetical protein HY304_02175 [candidate division Zixibacteria bacterium]|nr:hypothetical protein [candidate division Zixibacteria bacterium]
MILPLVLAPGVATAQIWSGSARLDYQSAPTNSAAATVGTLAQQYYVRIYDRLFYKNEATFLGHFAYRTAQAGQPVDFRPRYEWQLTGYGYGGRLSYEPYTIRRGDPNLDETHRLLRAGLLAQPQGGPRLTYDTQRNKQERGQSDAALDRWNSYALNWQHGTTALSGTFSRQVRTTSDSAGIILETYRTGSSTDRSLPGHHRVSLGYGYNRTWERRPGALGAQDQHTPTAGISGQPWQILNWSAQYSGRFTKLAPTGQLGAAHYSDHLASATATLGPVPGTSLALSRYVEANDPRAGDSTRRTDYWQGRLSTEGRFYRQIRGMATVYRIIYAGAPSGARYSDAYFVSLRGKPQAHAELSAELALADRHGTQPKRFAGNASLNTRLQPTSSWQWQIGYSALSAATALDNFDISEESFSTNAQYTPAANLSVSGGVSWRRNRLVTTSWNPVWSAAGTCRWPSFANISLNYSRRPTGVSGVTIPGARNGARSETLLADVLVWLGPRTTISANYNRGSDGRGLENTIWGLGLSTQF